MDVNLLNYSRNGQRQIGEIDCGYKNTMQSTIDDTCTNQSKVPTPPTSARNHNKSMHSLLASAQARKPAVTGHIALSRLNGHLIVVVLLLVYVAYGPCSVVSAALPSLSSPFPSSASAFTPLSSNLSLRTPLPYPSSTVLNPTPVLSPSKSSSNLNSIIATQIDYNENYNNKASFDIAYNQNSRSKRDTFSEPYEESNRINRNIETDYDQMSQMVLDRKISHQNHTLKELHLKKECHKAAVWKCGRIFVRATRFLKYTNNKDEKFKTQCTLRKAFFNCLKSIKDITHHPSRCITKSGQSQTDLTTKFPKHLADSLWASRICIGEASTTKSSN